MESFKWYFKEEKLNIFILKSLNILISKKNLQQTTGSSLHSHCEKQNHIVWYGKTNEYKTCVLSVLI